MADPANGSTPWYQTSWPTLNETAVLLGIPVDELRPRLRNQGVYANPDTRMPPEVVIDALEREGYTPRQLAPVSGRWRDPLADYERR